MNLKRFFYNGYYRIAAEVEVKKDGRMVKEHRKFNLDKSSNPDQWDKIKGNNEPLMKIANQRLCEFQWESNAADVLNFKKMGKPADGCLQTIPLTTTYPGLFTGSGYNHETGNTGELSLGFFFDHTTGLPVLPGSSIKGLLRSVFPNFKAQDCMEENLKGSPLQKSKAKFVVEELFKLGIKEEPSLLKLAHQLEIAIFEGVDFQKTKTARAEAKSRNQPDADSIICYLPMSQHDVFLEAFISRAGAGGHIVGTDALTPHGKDPLKNPIPLPFLKVLPEVEFTFQFLLKKSVLADDSEISVDQKVAVFEEILTTFGAGAKTNVGYGQFENPRKSEARWGSSGGDDIENPKPTEPEIFEKKPRMGDPIQAKVVAQGRVQIRTKTETWEVKMTGNCPSVGTVVNARINGLDRSGKINQVSYQGDAK